MFVALLLLLGQIALGPASLFAAADDLALNGGVPICHAGQADRSDTPGQHHVGTDCALCVMCHALGATALPPPPPGASTPPMAFVAIAQPLPPAGNPPVAPLLAATYPTGPPLLAG